MYRTFQNTNKEILNFIGLKNSFFQDEKDFTKSVLPTFISESYWFIATSSSLSDFGKLILEFDDGSIIFNVKSTFIATEGFSQRIYKIDFLSKKIPQKVIQSFTDYKNLLLEGERRKEERLEIGLKNWEKFNLTSPQQFFMFNSEEYKCILNNVSMHGLQIAGEIVQAKENFSKIKICVHFSNPDEYCFLSGTVVYFEPVVPLGKYYIKLDFPVSINWIKRLSEYKKNE